MVVGYRVDKASGMADKRAADRVDKVVGQNLAAGSDICSELFSIFIVF